jgi:hypothetical protein
MIELFGFEYFLEVIIVVAEQFENVLFEAILSRMKILIQVIQSLVNNLKDIYMLGHLLLILLLIGLTAKNENL